MAIPLPVCLRLHELFEYDPETGQIVRRNTGKAATYSVGNGYLNVYADGKGYRAHRVAFKMMLGRDPVGEIDHINRVRDDNRWINLRDVTRWENLKNRGWRPARDRPQRGATRSKDKWRSYISQDGRNVYLGTFDTLVEARAAYVGACKALGRMDP